MLFSLWGISTAFIIYYVQWGIPFQNKQAESSYCSKLIEKLIGFHKNLKTSKERLYNLLRWSLIPVLILITILIIWICCSDHNVAGIQNILVALLGAIPACVLWYYRDKAKLEDQKHVREELDMKLNNDFWDNIRKFMAMANGRNGESDAEKATALQALKNFYSHKNKEIHKCIHIFYQAYLNDYRKVRENNNIVNLQVQIPIIYRILSDYIYNHPSPYSDKKALELRYYILNNTCLERINLATAKLAGAMLMDNNFYGADLDHVDFSHAELCGSNFDHAHMLLAQLSNACLIFDIWGNFHPGISFDYTDMRGADICGVNFGNIDLSKTVFCDQDLLNLKHFSKIKIPKPVTCNNKTIFPDGFIYKEHEIINVDIESS